MTLKIPAQALAAALGAASKIVESRNTIPILSMVKLHAADGALTITTTNLDMEYNQSLEADVSADFSCCVDAKRLAAMAQAASAPITMSLDGSILTVKSGRSRWAAPALKADDFPSMPVASLSPPMALSGPVLASIVKRTVWAASDAPTQAYLGGMFINSGDSGAAFVATNGHVLGLIDTILPWPAGAPDIILPTGMARVIETASSGAETASLEWDHTKVRFKAGDVTITGKTIEGTFPQYRRAIPAPSEPYAVDADDLVDAVRRVRISSDAKERKLRIKRGDGCLHVRIEGTSGFEGEEEVPADCSEGYDAGVNADYLVNMLQAMDTDAITIEQADANSPFLMKPSAQKPDMTFVGVVMGMRV